MRTNKLLKLCLMLMACLSMAFAVTACTQTPEDEGPVLHDCVWDEGEVVREANCKTEGQKLYHCTVEKCTKTKTLSIPRTNEHDWETVSSTPASCTAEGEVNKKCKVCDKTSKEVLPKEKHTWVNGECDVCHTVQKKSFGAEELAELEVVSKYTQNIEIPETVYTVLGSEEKTNDVINKTATVDELSFTRAIRLGGKANVTDGTAITRVIMAVYREAGTITVYAVKNTQTNIALYNENGELISNYELGAVAGKYVFKIAAAGTYYIGGGQDSTGALTSGSTDIFAIDFSDEEVHVCTDWVFDHNETEPTCYTDGKAIYKCAESTCNETQERVVPRAHSFNDESGKCTVCGVDTVEQLDITSLDASYTANAQISEVFSILATDGKDVAVADKKATVDGVSYTKAINLKGRLNSSDLVLDASSGAPDAAYGRAIKIVMPSAGVIVVIANKNSATALQIVTATKVVATHEISSVADAWVIKIEEAGTYYVGTTSGSAYVYGISAEYIAPEHVHEWSEWEVETPATCIAEGKEVRHCTGNGCNETEERPIAKTAHNWVDGACTNTGCTAVQSVSFGAEQLQAVKSQSYLANVEIPETVYTVMACDSTQSADGKDKNIEIKSQNATIGDKTFTKAVHLSGKGNVAAGNAFSRVIKADYREAGTITIYTKKDSAVSLIVYTADGTVLNTYTYENKTATSYTVEVEAGTYYIGTGSGSAYVFSIEFTKSAEQDNGTENDPANLPAPEAEIVKNEN